MVAMPCIIAVPSIFIVAPNGTVKDEIFDFTLKFLFKFCSVTGIVALLLDVEKANRTICLIPFTNVLILTSPKNLTKGM